MTNSLFTVEVKLHDDRCCQGCPYFAILMSDFCYKLHVKLSEADDPNYYMYFRDVNCPLKPVIKEENND